VARWLVILLVAGAVIDGVAILSTVSQVDLLERAQRGETMADGAASANDLRQQFIGAVQFIVCVATVVLFLRWISRAYRNLGALSSRKLSFTPGWAIGAWFVPFLNLVRPFQIVRETWWISSAPSDAERSAPAFSPSAPAVIKWWWAVYLVSGFLGQEVLRTSLSAKSVPDLLSSSYLSIAADSIGIPSALLAIQVVRLISTRQNTAAQGASRHVLG